MQGRRKLRRVAIGSAVTAVLALITAVLTLAPMPSGGPSGLDKLYHMLVFASLAFPLPLVRPRLAIWVVMGVVAYGGIIELIQPTFGRQAEWADFGADGIGAAVGAMIARQLGLRLRKSRENNNHDDSITEAWLTEDPALVCDTLETGSARPE